MTSFESTYRSDAATISLTTVESGEHLLEWTDGINEWLETYVELPVALARFAVLVECVNQARLFANDSTVFPSHARYFLDSQLQVELPRSRFQLGQRVRVTLALPRPTTYVAEFLREERHDDQTLTGIALVRVVDPGDSSHRVGDEVHVGVVALEPA